MSKHIRNAQHHTPWIYPQIPSDFRAVFYENCQISKVRKGEKLSFNLGSIENGKKYLIYLCSGLLLNYREVNSLNKELFTGIVLPNCAAGHSNFFNLSDNSEFLIASVESEVMILPVNKLAAAFLQKNNLKDSAFKYFIACLKSESEGAHIIGTKNIEQRAILLFSSLIDAYKMEKTRDEYQLPLKLTNEEIRRIIFSTRKTINTLIPKWKRENLYSLDINGTYINRALLNRQMTSY